MQSTKRNYGWHKDREDNRDIPYRLAAPVPLPDAVDLRSQCPAVYDQGQLGSCTANAISAAIEFNLKKQKLDCFTPSRLFIYYNERSMEGTINEDSGAQIRDGIKSVNAIGVCAETIWPYNVSKFTNKPSMAAYIDAKGTQATSYQRINNEDLQALLQCLASGYPFVFGFNVYSAFESAKVAKTGQLNLPTAKEQCMGGHAVLCVGYDLKKKRFLVRNSWGDSWGQAGYFTIPFSYLTNQELASDFWVIKLVS